jgi:ribosome recycling factor
MSLLLHRATAACAAPAWCARAVPSAARASAGAAARRLLGSSLPRQSSLFSPLDAIPARAPKAKGGKKAPAAAAAPGGGAAGASAASAASGAAGPSSASSGGDDLDIDGGGDGESGPGGAAGGKGDLKTVLARQLDYAKRELAKLRGATANPNMLDGVLVEAYGERQPLPSLAQISLKNSTLLVVAPFDGALASAVADAIRDADLNLNPTVDGDAVRVPVPRASKETREQTVKVVSKIAEAAKTRIRRARQVALERLRKQEGVSEDDIRRETKTVDEEVARATAEVAKAADKKRVEIEQG